MKVRINRKAEVKKAEVERDDTFVYATQDKVTKNQIRFHIDKNKYGFTGVLYFPKEHLRGKTPPERLKMKIVFDRD